VAHVLRGERAQLDFPTNGADGQRRARALGVAALITGVGPLLGAWIEGGEVETDDALARVLARHLAHARAREARIRAAVLPVLARMERSGLAPGVIKGFHTAYAYFPEPGTRPFADVDVVVAPEGIAAAECVLHDAGFIPDARSGTASYKREWYPPEGRGDVWSHELWHARSRWKLELHDGLNFNAVVQHVRATQTPRLAEVLGLDGVSLRVADANELIVLLATHGSTELYSHRLLRLVELVLVVRRTTALGTLDWGAVEASLAARDVLRFGYPMLALTERLAPGTVALDTLARLADATTRRVRAVADALSATAPIVDRGFSMRDRLMWVRGARATMARLWRMVAPPEGVSTRERLRIYRHRATRLLTLDRSSRSDSDAGDG
jgi:hypothetical protein